MTLQSSGRISLADVNNEFGKGYALGSYYQEAIKRPGDESISLSDLYGKSNLIIRYITSDGNNVYASEPFGNYWNQNVRKLLIINSGVTLGSTNQNLAAFIVGNLNYGQFNGTLTVVNYGNIYGAMGLPGNPGTKGGNAMRADYNVTVNNQGRIWAGGGGGGDGGGGSYIYQSGSHVEAVYSGDCPSLQLCCNTVRGGYGVWCCQMYANYCPYYQNVPDYSTAYTTGGSGGYGRGWDNQQGSRSGSDGGAYAGRGGDGGDWGQDGNRGGDGYNQNYQVINYGANPGLSGYCVNGYSLVNWENRGDLKGPGNN